jgi:hypothetical protein
MLYKRTTIMVDDDWGHFIDIDDTPMNKINLGYHKMVYNVDPHYTTTNPYCLYQMLSETYLMALEIPIRNTIKDSCICSTFVTTFTLGSIMLCFII